MVILLNSSTLEILDSTETKAGMINGVNYSTVLNNRGANLTVSSGNIILSKSGTYSAILNKGELVLQSSGKIQTTPSSNTYAVWNDGNMKTLGGEVKAAGIAIYNGVYSTGNNYTFIYNGDKLESNNTGKASSVASSHIKIDLTGKSGTFNLAVNAEISSENSDYGYATITKTEDTPAYNMSNGRFMFISGTKSAKDYTTTLTGGEIYYLHLGYRKDSSVNTGKDKLTINYIKLDEELLKIEEEKINISNLLVEDGKIEGTTAIYNNDKATITINNGMIIGAGTASTYGIYNNSIGEFNFNGGSISTSTTNSNSTYSYGIYNNSSGTINIKKGNINVSCSGSYSSSTSYGIYNMTTGTINIGLDDGNIDPSLLVIESTSSYSSDGLYNIEGTINFYDGKIIAKSIIEGDITSIAKDTELEITADSNDIKTAILVNVLSPIAKIGDTTYKTLQDAFNAVEANQNDLTTVTLLRNATILNKQNKLIVNENQKIYLDLNGYQLIIANEEGIDNRGTLEIGSKEETISFNASDLVNNGTYYFQDDGTGKIVPNNLNTSGTANSYIKIDLSSLTGNYHIVINSETTNTNNRGIRICNYYRKYRCTFLYF